MDWNVIVSVQQHGYKAARRLLHEYGKIRSTAFFNVMIMQVADIDEFLEDMHTLYSMHVPALEHIGRILPVTEQFVFQSPEEFEAKAKAAAEGWLDELAGRHFYVRMHRRGFKGRLSSQAEESFLDEYILQRLQEKQLSPAKVDFAGAERVIAIETLGQQAGMSLWRAEQMVRYPFLKLA